MKWGWLLGWATPVPWFEAFVRAGWPDADHVLVPPGPDSWGTLEAGAPFDQIAGYSLGSLLLLGDAARVDRLAHRVHLLAPIWGFPSEMDRGGRISRAELRGLARGVRRDWPTAVRGFYATAGLDADPRTLSPKAVRELPWGLDCLERIRLDAGLPSGWTARCGDADTLLDARRLRDLVPEIAVVSGATHSPDGLLRALAEDLR
jgi:hypothetical protein